MDEDIVAQRILSEFEEMPGLMLTVSQAARLLGSTRRGVSWYSTRL